MSDKIRAAVYCRLAHENDEIMETQIEQVSRYAVEHGYNDISVYADNGASGNNYRRSAFSKMNADIAAGEINTIIVRSIDRIGRNFFKTEHWINDLRKKGVVIKSLDNSCEDICSPIFDTLHCFIMEKLKKQRKTTRRPINSPFYNEGGANNGS